MSTLDDALARTLATPALASVAQERARQVLQWGDPHDDVEHADGALADAAAVMACSTRAIWNNVYGRQSDLWPLALRDRHEGDRRQQLVIAAALLLAEIERLDRGGEP